MVVDSVEEGGELSGVWVIEDIFSLLGISTLIELVVLFVSDESSIGAIINFVSILTKLSGVVEGLLGLSIIFELIVSEVISPSDTVVKLSGGIIIIPFHLWVILEKSLEFGQFHDTSFVWKGGG